MTANEQNNLERLRDRIHKGELTVDQANVEMVRFAMAYSLWADIRNRHNNRMAVNKFANRCFEIAG